MSGTNLKKEMDMLHGPMTGNIFIFAIPVMLTTILQQAFHSVDVAVIGKFCGENELAAIGSCATLVALINNLVMGYAAGSNVIIAQLIGAGNKDSINRAVRTGIFLAIVSGVIASTLGIILAPSILKLISTPSEILPLAILYIRLYLTGIPFIMVYNFTSSILRSKGETKKPLYCLILAGITNVGLNVIFVTQFNMGVAGVSVATAISNMLSCFLALMILLKEKDEFHLNIKNLKPDKKILIDIIKVGFPIGIQNAMFPLSNTIFQSGINSLGTLVIAGSATASSIDSISHAVVSGFVQASLSFVSQNFGAKNIERCQRAVKECILYAFIVSTVFDIFIYFFYDTVCSLFTNEPAVLFYAKQKSQITYLTIFTSILMNIYTNALRAMGRSTLSSSVSIFGICAFRIIWRYTAFELIRDFRTLLWGFPISWIITAAILYICYVKTIKKYKTEFSYREEQYLGKQ